MELNLRKFIISQNALFSFIPILFVALILTSALNAVLIFLSLKLGNFNLASVIII